MNKIGLKIRRYKDGPADIKTVNPGDWTKKVVDIRNTLNLYANDDMSRFATFMSFGETGTYITVARRIGGRGGENVAAWLFIPNTITVDGKQVVSLVNAVKGELLKTQIDENAINQLFSYTYPETQVAPFLSSKPMGANAPTARRTYGTAANIPSLEQLLGENRYQPYYAEYAAILLTGADSLPLDPVASASVKDLTTLSLKEYGTLLPPAPGSLPTGTKAYINGRELAMPMMLEKGTVMINLKRLGYEECVDSIRLYEKCQQYQPAGLKWRKIIDPKNIRVIDDMGTPVKNAQITINGSGINARVAVPEEMLSQVHVTVKCNGYKQADATLYYDLTRGSTSIRMKRTAPPTRGNGGYSSRELEEARKTGFEQGRKSGLFTGILSTIAVFALAAGAYFAIHSIWGEKEPPKQETLAQAEGEANNDAPEEASKSETDAAATDSIAAFNYLKKCNGILNKDEMAKIKYLDGLWDDLNNFDLERITKDWNDKLGEKGGEYFDKIVTHAKECIRKGLLDKAKQKNNGLYNTANDPNITVQNYINWINDGCKNYKPTPPPSSTPVNNVRERANSSSGNNVHRGGSNNRHNSHTGSKSSTNSASSAQRGGGNIDG